MMSILHYKEHVVYIIFSVSCITGPTLGVFAGGIITHKLGGYTDPRSFSAVCLVGFLTSVVGVPIPFVDKVYIVVPLLWLLLFFGGFMMPALTGIIISSAPTNLKTLSNSFAFFCYNIFGYLPAPFLYGAV